MYPSSGQKIKKRYQVIEPVGRGGMAEVFKVWDNRRAVHLAMKILRQDIAQGPVFLRRFQRGANALSKRFAGSLQLIRISSSPKGDTFLEEHKLWPT